MIILDCKIGKMDKADPRYPTETRKTPDGSPIPHTDVYLCQCETDEGPFEASFLVTQEMTPEYLSGIIMTFGAAVRRMPWGQKESEAA